MFGDIVRNIRLSQTWVEEQVATLRSDYGFADDGDAFQALAYGLLFETDYDIPPAEKIEGHGEKQIDIIKIDEDEENEQATINIIQSKYHKGFPSNTLVLIGNGLEWIFEMPEKDYKKLDNQRFIFKIEEIRKLRSKYGHDGLVVNVHLVTLGDTSDLLKSKGAKEYNEEKGKLLSKYSNLFHEFNFRDVGAFELTEFIEQQHRTRRKVDADIEIEYDKNRPSLIEYVNSTCKCNSLFEEYLKRGSESKAFTWSKIQF
jgi:hypothetical protein